MITEIAIKNFRCYHESHFKGFKRINLIGGLNNSGKTVLLEAILLGTAPISNNVLTLKKLRLEENDKELAEYTWDSFFYKQNKKQPITLITKNNIGDVFEIEIECDEDISSIIDDLEKGRVDKEDVKSIISSLVNDEDGISSVLKLTETTHQASLFIVPNGSGQFIVRQLNSFSLVQNANIIPASNKRKPAFLAKEFGIAERKGKSDFVLDALKIVDKEIDSIKVSVVGGAHLEIKRNSEPFLASGLFGDAINKILDIVLTIVNNDSSVLLIDEIENGVHYTIQQDFWKFLFQLSKELNVQLFLTTHSLEMLKAFAEVGKEFEEDAAYFELFKRPATGEIDNNLHTMETLLFELSNNLTVRGE